MHSRRVFLCAVPLIIASAMILGIVLFDDDLDCEADGSSNVWIDPNYRDPPKADYTIRLTDDLSFKSNDPAYTVKWSTTDASGTDSSDAARTLALYLGFAKSGVSGYSYTADECLPSWITWDARKTSSETGEVSITIRPALQQVSEDTHGSYWIWFECTYPDFLSTKKSSYLVKFEVDVQWAGGVIVPDSYSTFVLRLDYGFGDGTNNKTFRQVLPADATEYRFGVSGTAISRDGFVFKGWSMVSGSKTTDIGEEFPLNIGSAAVIKSIDDKGNPVYTCTIYAVWEEVPKPSYVIPDDLRDLLNLLRDPFILALFVLTCFLVAVVVRVRRQGMV